MDAMTVPASVDSLATVGHYVMQAAAEAGLEQKAAYRLRQAVDEVATNVCLYAYRETGVPGDLTVRADLSDERLTIILEDTGTPFDPRSRAMPDSADLAKPLEERPIGGLGILLAAEGVDEFGYEWVGGRNRNIFSMNRPRASQEMNSLRGNEK